MSLVLNLYSFRDNQKWSLFQTDLCHLFHVDHRSSIKIFREEGEESLPLLGIVDLLVLLEEGENLREDVVDLRLEDDLPLLGEEDVDLP